MSSLSESQYKLMTLTQRKRRMKEKMLLNSAGQGEGLKNKPIKHHKT